MKSRISRCLQSSLLLCAVLTGCATGSPETATPTKHFHSPWRYAHMNHRHIRPWDKDQKPLFPQCSVCTRASATEPAPK